MTLSLICDLHAFIHYVPLLQPGCQKLSVGLSKTKVSDQIVNVFLVREVRPSLLNHICETVIWIFNIFLAIWLAAVSWRWLITLQGSWNWQLGAVWYWGNGRKNVWINNLRCILASATFGRIRHAEVAVAWVVSWLQLNSQDSKLHDSLFSSASTCNIADIIINYINLKTGNFTHYLIKGMILTYNKFFYSTLTYVKTFQLQLLKLY